MLASNPRRTLAPILLLLLGSMTPALCAQPSLLGLNETLSALGTCLGPDGASVAELRTGLVIGWGNERPRDGRPLPPPPAVYLRSLDRDLRMCRAASQIKDQVQRQRVLHGVVDDIAVKIQDCRHFGMGRLIPVYVTTRRGPVSENGWEVYYRWDCSCSGGLEPDELRAPQLTSPSTIHLPPGTYLFRAQRNATALAATASTARVIVGMQPVTQVELIIP